MDVEELFRKHTLPELKDVEKKFRTDVERKKEELRELVSQRYRDLLDAADQIKGMHVSIASVTDQLKLCRSLETVLETQARRTNNAAVVDPARNQPESLEVFGGSFEVLDGSFDRLLSLAPEIISKSLDNDQPLRAALFFSFVRNLVWRKSAEKPDLPEDPRWDFIRVYSDFIAENVRTQFEKISYEPHELLGYFAAAVVLNNSTSNLDSLRVFLNVRTLVIRQLLTASSTLSNREVLRLSLLCVLETLRGVHEIFHQSADVTGCVKKAAEAVREDFLEEIFFGKTSFSRLFDDIVSSALPPDEFASVESGKEALIVWLDTTVVAEITENLDSALNYVASIQSISEISRTLTAVLAEENAKIPSFAKIEQDFSLPAAGVVDLFNKSVRSRFGSLLRERTAFVLKEIERQLAGNQSTFSPEDSSPSRKRFVTSLTGVDATTDGKNNRRIKFPGVKQTDRISSIASAGRIGVTQIATELEKLRHEIKQTELSEDETGPAWMLEDVRKAYSEMISALLPLVRARLDDDQALSARHQSVYAFFCDLAAHDVFFLGGAISGFSQFVARQMDGCISLIFMDWLSKTLETWRQSTLQSLKENENPTRWALHTPPFQKNTIEEENETGEMVQYTVTVPWRASVTCHLALQSLHDALVDFKAGIRKVPVTEAATKQIFLTVAQCYCDYVENGLPSNMTKNQTLQLIFDVKVILIFGKRRKLFSAVTVQMVQRMVDRISGSIDPIDYHVLLPFLDKNVLAHVSAVQNLYFSLTFLDGGMPGPASDCLFPSDSSDSFKSAASSNFLGSKPLWFSQSSLFSSKT